MSEVKNKDSSSKNGMSLYSAIMVTILFFTTIFIGNELRLLSAIKDDGRIIAAKINNLEKGQPSGPFARLNINSSPLSPVKKYYLVSVSVNGENYYVMENKNVDLCVNLRVDHKINAIYKTLENGTSELDFKKIINECENKEMLKLTPSK
jgi:hypothetical protein